MSKPIEIIVVGSRAVYINDYRVAGGKPWNSEGLPHQTFRATLEDILDAFALDDLQKAVEDRIARRDAHKAEAA